jgi:hypothetical protein
MILLKFYYERNEYHVTDNAFNTIILTKECVKGHIANRSEGKRITNFPLKEVLEGIVDYDLCRYIKQSQRDEFLSKIKEAARNLCKE